MLTVLITASAIATSARTAVISLTRSGMRPTHCRNSCQRRAGPGGTKKDMPPGGGGAGGGPHPAPGGGQPRRRAVHPSGGGGHRGGDAPACLAGGAGTHIAEDI